MTPTHLKREDTADDGNSSDEIRPPGLSPMRASSRWLLDRVVASLGALAMAAIFGPGVDWLWALLGWGQDSGRAVIAFIAGFTVITVMQLLAAHREGLERHRQSVQRLHSSLAEGSGDAVTQALVSHIAGEQSDLQAAMVRLRRHLVSWKQEVAEMQGSGILVDSSSSVDLWRAMAHGQDSFVWVETQIYDVNTEWTEPWRIWLKEVGATESVEVRCILLVSRKDLLDQWTRVSELKRFLSSRRIRLSWSDQDIVQSSFAGTFSDFYCLLKFGRSAFARVTEVSSGAYASGSPFRISITRQALDERSDEIMRVISSVSKPIGRKRPR